MENLMEMAHRNRVKHFTNQLMITSTNNSKTLKNPAEVMSHCPYLVTCPDITFTLFMHLGRWIMGWTGGCVFLRSSSQSLEFVAGRRGKSRWFINSNIMEEGKAVTRFRGVGVSFKESIICFPYIHGLWMSSETSKSRFFSDWRRSALSQKHILLLWDKYHIPRLWRMSWLHRLA